MEHKQPASMTTMTAMTGEHPPSFADTTNTLTLSVVDGNDTQCTTTPPQTSTLMTATSTNPAMMTMCPPPTAASNNNNNNNNQLTTASNGDNIPTTPGFQATTDGHQHP